MTHLFKIGFISFVLFCTQFIAPTYASDASLKRIVGFSPDGKYFTFEQYGIQDGSGWPYVDIYFIDTVNNTWVQDPIRMTVKDETASIAKVRASAIAQATPTIKQLNTTLHGFTLVSNPITQLDRDKYNAHFGIHPSAPTLDQYKLQLTTSNANSAKCNQYTADAKKFNLTLTSVNNNKIIEKYADANLPTSRNCPIDYSISDVHYFEAVNGDVIFMTFINIMAYGFEGADRRFMVIPFYISK